MHHVINNTVYLNILRFNCHMNEHIHSTLYFTLVHTGLYKNWIERHQVINTITKRKSRKIDTVLRGNKKLTSFRRQ